MRSQTSPSRTVYSESSLELPVTLGIALNNTGWLQLLFKGRMHMKILEHYLQIWK